MSRRAEHQSAEGRVPPSESSQRTDGAGGAADRLPFGVQEVDEIGVVRSG